MYLNGRRIAQFIPDEEKTTVHKIGNLFFTSNQLSKTVSLNLNVKSMLRISEVTVDLNGDDSSVKSSGESISDKDTYPGSSFSVEVEVCNKYDDIGIIPIVWFILFYCLN
jgi:hypothetical protein